MTSDWLTSKFQIASDGTNIIVYDGEDSEGNPVQISCDPTVLVNAGTTSDPPTYTELSGLDIAKQGWQPIFDQWKENEIVS